MCGFAGGRGHDRRATATSTSTTCGRSSAPKTAGIMLTNPNTLGAVRAQIAEIATLVHDARRPALLRRRQPERDPRHRRGPATWASTSCTSTCTRRSRTPHGGGGPGAGPVGVRDAPRAVPAGAGGRRGDGDSYRGSTTTGRSRSAGCAASAGNVGVLLRAYAYIRMLGRRGLRARRRDGGAQRQLPAGAAARMRFDAAVSDAPLHARVRRSRRGRLKREHGVTRAGRRQAAARLRLPRRRRSTSR